MQTKRKWAQIVFLILACLLLVAVFAACGEDKKGQETPAGDGAAQSGEATTPTETQKEFTPGMTYASNDSGTGYILVAGTSLVENIVIPGTYNGKPVTSIGESAFSEFSALQSVTIPASVKEINEKAFYSCTNLKSVSFDANSQLTSIGKDAFCACHKLISIVIPKNVATIGKGAFAASADYLHASETSMALKNITFAQNSQLKSIGDYAFYYCSNLTSITIPEGVTSIGNNAFNNCDNLTSITIPASVKSIGGSAFYYCRALSSVTFAPNSKLTEIGNFAFCGCQNLTNITIPAGVTSIDNGTFKNCSRLTSIRIPAGVTSIKKWAFEGCDRLTSVTFANTTGWYRAGYYIDVTNASTNASNLKSNYSNYEWYRE